MRTVSHHFVLSTLKIFLVRKDMDKLLQGYQEKKNLHQPKFLILLIILASAWFPKNVQVLSVRISKGPKASSARLPPRLFLDCFMPFSILLLLILQPLGPVFLRLNHLLETLSRSTWLIVLRFPTGWTK